MPNAIRDTKYLSKPRPSKLIVHAVDDGWVASQTRKAALSTLPAEPQSYDENATISSLVSAVMTTPLFGESAVLYKMRPSDTGAQLAKLVDLLLPKIRNPMLLLCRGNQADYLTESNHVGEYIIIRQSNLAEAKERHSMVAHALSLLYKNPPAPDSWNSAASEWVGSVEEAERHPTSLYLYLDLLAATSASELGELNLEEALRHLPATQKRQYPEVATHLYAHSRKPSPANSQALLYQIFKHSADASAMRMLAGAIELAAVEGATTSTAIKQDPDPKVHEFKRKVILEGGALTPPQVIRLQIVAQQLAEALRVSRNPRAACLTLLNSAI